jgi:prefoldin subunit 5
MKDQRDQIEERLQALNAEYEAGQKMLAELEQKRAAITSTMLRIEGAIQVLKELQGAAADPAAANGSQPDARK